MPEMRDPAELLVEAMEHLSVEDRKRLTAWMLTRGTRQYRWLSREGSTTTTPLAARLPYAAYPNDSGLAEMLVTGASVTGDHQVVPVRLPADLHAQLRDWCAEHGFSMATVIRGLLTRFLAGQDDEQAD